MLEASGQLVGLLVEFVVGAGIAEPTEGQVIGVGAGGFFEEVVQLLRAALGYLLRHGAELPQLGYFFLGQEEHVADRYRGAVANLGENGLHVLGQKGRFAGGSSAGAAEAEGGRVGGIGPEAHRDAPGLVGVLGFGGGEG